MPDNDKETTEETTEETQESTTQEDETTEKETESSTETTTNESTEEKEEKQKETSEKNEKSDTPKGKMDKLPDSFSPDSHPGWTSIKDIDIAAAVGIQDLRGIMGNSDDLKKRQHILDPSKYKTEYKKPNPGKMPNNQDPFPVDLKIEEFEAHSPATNVYKIVTHVHGSAAAKAAMSVGTNAEKRLIKLENNMATIMRLLFRMGSRMTINCVYYGGQMAA